MQIESSSLDVEHILSELGMAILHRKPTRIKISLRDLAQISWIRNEIEKVQQEEEKYRKGMIHECDADVSVVTIRELKESHLFTKQDVEDGTWALTLIRQALRTKPIDATHITFYTA